jgi:5-methylcytosine-specific restriction endonuclease McrA
MPKQHVPAKLKRAVTARAQGCCEYCRSQVRFAIQSFSIDHIIPLDAGGKTVSDNLALACEGCNAPKHAKSQGHDSVTDRPVPLFNPRRQKWHDHFTWNLDFTLIIGLTPTGRATVETLQLNREGVMNLRRALYIIGEHPRD